MSRETSEWLNTMTLIGFTEKRGNAWHYRESVQGDEPNHYPQAVPVADITRRLFSWQPIEGSIESTYITEEGVGKLIDATRKSILRPPSSLSLDDPGAFLGIFKKGYKIHDYEQWLIQNVDVIVSQGLDAGSAGLLKGGAQAWVSFEVPETIETPEGVTFRPNLLAATSLDGSMSTTYKRCVTNTVCDNTMSAALGESGQQVKIKHSVNSLNRLSEVRDALAIVHTIADDFAAQVKALCEVKVSSGDFVKFLETVSPTEGKDKGRGLTMAENKQSDLSQLWNHDERVAPWKGTAYGVLQAMNTYTHHKQTVKGVSRAERNMDRAVSGGVDKLDTETVSTILEIVG